MTKKLPPPKKKLPPTRQEATSKLPKRKSKEYYKRLKYQFREANQKFITCLRFDPPTAAERKKVEGRGALSAPGIVRVGGWVAHQRYFQHIMSTYFNRKPYQCEIVEAGAHRGHAVWIVASCSEEKFAEAIKVLEDMTTLVAVKDFGRMMR